MLIAPRERQVPLIFTLPCQRGDKKTGSLGRQACLLSPPRLCNPTPHASQMLARTNKYLDSYGWISSWIYLCRCPRLHVIGDCTLMWRFHSTAPTTSGCGNNSLLRAWLRLTLQWGELGEPGEPGVSTRCFWLTQLTRLARPPARAGVKTESGKLESVICNVKLAQPLAALRLGDMGCLIRLVDSEKKMKLVQIKQ